MSSGDQTQQPSWLSDCNSDWKIVRAKYLLAERKELSTDGSETLLSISEYYGVKPRLESHGNDTLLTRAESLEGYKIVRRKDLAMNIMLAWKGAQGISEYDGIVSPAYAVFELDQSQLHPGYAHYLFRSDTYASEFRRQSTGVMDSRLRLYPEIFGGVAVLLPPIDVQIAIASYLDTETKRIDVLIEEKNKLSEQLAELRTRAIYEAVFVEQVGWKRSRLKFVSDRIVDTEHKTCPYFDDGKYMVVRTTNIKSGRLVFNDAKYTNEDGFRDWTQRALPQPDDILLTREAPAGEACLVPEDVPLCVGQRTVLIKVDRRIAHPEFVLWSLYGGLSAQFIADLSRGSTVPHFNMGDIGNIPLCTGPLSEQVARTEHLKKQLTQIDELTEHVMKEVEKLSELRSSTITDAVLGRINIQA